MNILHVIETDIIGGPGKGILQLLKAFQNTDLHLHICGFSGRKNIRQNEFKNAVLAGGYSFLELNERFRFDPGTIHQIKKIITDYKIDIVETHGYKGNALLYALRKKIDIPWISWVHGWTNEDFKIRIYNRLDRWLLKSPDHIIAVSRTMKDNLENHGLESKKITVIPNAVETLTVPAESRKRIRNIYGIDIDTPLIGVIGRLSPEKGQMDFLKALQQVSKEIPNVRAMIIGDGPDRQSLEDFAAQHSLTDSVIFTGYLSNIAVMYSALDLVVMPSLSEGMPNVALEALAFGKPLIATAVGGVPEVIQSNINGMLVAPSAPREMAEQIVFLLNNPHRSLDLAENGRKVVTESFSLGMRIHRIMDIYQIFMDSRCGGPTNREQ